MRKHPFRNSIIYRIDFQRLRSLIENRNKDNDKHPYELYMSMKSLKKTLYPFPKNSIIEKSRTVIGESFTLFYVKDKMNVFWARLSYTMSKKNAENVFPKCRELLESCKGERDFNTKKLIAFLQDAVQYDAVLSEIKFNIVLERELRELIMLVTQPDKLKKAVEDYHESVVHDLDCIYRLRNQLIHSAKSRDDSLEYISLRLYRYVNSIVATILYYKKRNEDISIIEILNSLHHTYEVYQEKLLQYGKAKNISVDKGYEIVHPKYLFLE